MTFAFGAHPASGINRNMPVFGIFRNPLYFVTNWELGARTSISFPEGFRYKGATTRCRYTTLCASLSDSETGFREKGFGMRFRTGCTGLAAGNCWGVGAGVTRGCGGGVACGVWEFAVAARNVKNANA